VIAMIVPFVTLILRESSPCVNPYAKSKSETFTRLELSLSGNCTHA
jgi:hypothetical protein